MIISQREAMSRGTEEFRIVDIALRRKDIVCGDDGYYVYWPEDRNVGAIAAWELRAIADHLDRMNMAWDWIINNDPKINGEEKT
jgi:hypothetical protein